jgi:hypothetical protein
MLAIDYQQLKNMKKGNIRNILNEFYNAIIGITEEFGKKLQDMNKALLYLNRKIERLENVS